MTARLDVIVSTDAPAPEDSIARHPLGSKARVLLSSVFGPFAQDDEYGSRTINPMELWHNQVTRVQGPFSVRMFHRSWGLMLMKANMQAPCTRVTWLCHSSMGLMVRLPYSSSCAKGPNTLESSTRALLPSGWRAMESSGAGASVETMTSRRAVMDSWAFLVAPGGRASDF